LALQRKERFKAANASGSILGHMDAAHIAHAIDVFSLPNPACSA